MKITRDIPMPWLIGYAVGAIAQAVLLFATVQNQGQAIHDLVSEVRELRNDARVGGLNVRALDVQVADLRRRVEQLEAKR